MALSIGKAWDDARAALAANRRLIWPVALGLLLVPAVITSMVEPPAAPGEQPAPGSWMWVTLAMIIIMLVGQMAIVLLSSGRQGSVGEAIGRGFRRLPTLLLSALAVMLPVILIFSVLLAMAGLGTSADGQLSVKGMSSTGWLLLLIGFLLLIVVGVRLTPLIVIVASEDVGPIAALKRSFMLTRGYFWKLFGFVVLASIAFLIVAWAAGAVVGSIAVMLLGRPDAWSVSLLLVALAAGLIQAGFVALYTAMVTRITAQLNGSSAPIAT